MKRVLILLSLISLIASCTKSKDAGNKIIAAPNIVLILADDMGYGDIEAYNPDSHISTPNLNNLAEDGMRFTDAHTNSAVCSPTRYGLLTGRYAWRTRLKNGVLSGYSNHLHFPGHILPASPTFCFVLLQPIIDSWLPVTLTVFSVHVSDSW